MSRQNQSMRWYRHLLRLLPRAFFALALMGSLCHVSQAQSPAVADREQRGADNETRYAVINLGAGTVSTVPVINAAGQVAYTLANGGQDSRALFYDGVRIRDMGTLGGARSFSMAINYAGQVAGFSTVAGDQQYHAFRWSPRFGMTDLGTPPGGSDSQGYALNSHGDVAGRWSPGVDSAAFKWSAATGMTVLASPGYTGTEARAIDETGLIAGHGFTAGLTKHALVWPRHGAVVDIGNLGGGYAEVIGISALGQVAGMSPRPNGRNHAYIWTRSRGIEDLGTAGGTESLARATSASGHVVGAILFPSQNGVVTHGFSWTRATGMVDLNAHSGNSSIALGVNNRGQVVGWTIDGQVQKAIVWNAAGGMIDLGRRLDRPPAGLALQTAVAIADNGDIVATSNAGLVLLKAAGPRSHGTLGPIAAPAMVQVGIPLAASVSLAGDALPDAPAINWTWGDEDGGAPGAAVRPDAAGRSSASHTYAQPGIYTVTAALPDASGGAVQVRRDVTVAQAASGGASGQGWFLSPSGAMRDGHGDAARASFSFVTMPDRHGVTGGQAARLHFQAGLLDFRGDAVPAAVLREGGMRFEGSGKINGTGDYRFSLVTMAGSAGTGRIGLKIWHFDTTRMRDVVDYDNLGTGTAQHGSGIAEGTIVVRQ